VGSADVAQQFLRAGLLDEINLDLVPVLLGGGVRLFDRLEGVQRRLERTRVVESDGVTHLRFRVLAQPEQATFGRPRAPSRA
jgi:dihydrofolate reductase